MNRTNVIAGDLLRWLDPQEGAIPAPRDYLAVAHIVGGPVTEPELVRVVQRLESYGLVECYRTLGSLLPVGVHLLDPGRECLDDYGGDIRAWRDAQGGSGSTTYDQRVTITQGDNAQAVAHAQDVAQDMTLTLDPERLGLGAQAAGEVAELLPEQHRDAVQAASRELTEATKSGDDSAMRRATARLVTALGPASSLFVVVRFIIDLLSGGLGG